MREAVYKLAPALYVLANRPDPNGETRPFSYRVPEMNWSLIDYYDAENELIQRGDVSRVTKGTNTKYSAINYKDGCMEFRVFDPVFESPEQVLDNLVVISKLLHFFTEDRAVLDVFNKLDKSKYAFAIGDSVTNNLNNWLDDVKVLPALYFGLTLIKPDYLSLEQIRKRVGFTITGDKLLRKESQLQKQVDAAYELYLERCRQVQELNESIRGIGLDRDVLPIRPVSKQEFDTQFKKSNSRIYYFNGEEV